MYGPEDGDDHAEQHGENHAGHNAGHQHIAHRHLGQRAIDHKHHRGRNDGSQHATEGGKTRRESFVVTLTLHLGNHDLRHDGDLGSGGPKDGGDHHVCEHVYIGQTRPE